MTLGRTAGYSHPGRKRRHNEDAYVVEPPLFAVADGMGGAKAGEVASSLAAAALTEGADAGSGAERLVSLIQEANRRVFERASADDSASGMGTTMTVALVEDGAVTIGHVGDSRAYLIREGALEQLTDDHSLVAELVRSGKLTPEEAELHPQRSVITRAVGTEPEVDVDTFSVQAEPGDVFLICSDGLTDMVDEGTMLEVVRRHIDDLDAAAKALVSAANKGGGDDNITVVFFQISAEAPAEQTETLQLPAAEVEAAQTEDEDTLSGLDAVPAVDTAVIPPGEAAAIGASTEAGELKRRPVLRLVLAVLVLVAMAFAALVLWYALYGS